MTAGAGPFAPRTVLGLVVVGALAFVAVLWTIGAGMAGGIADSGQPTVAGRGLNGYAALAGFLERRGFAVERIQSKPALRRPVLAILTPPQAADGKAIARLVESRRRDGPTIVITPKWDAVPIARLVPGARRGWVALGGASSPSWPGFHDDIALALEPMRAGGRVAGWRGGGTRGALPVSETVQSGQGAHLVPLVVGEQDGRILAAWLDDGGDYPALRAMSLRPPPPPAEETADNGRYPLVFVFEPDLLDNYGFADAANAALAERLVQASLDGLPPRVGFDLTLNGLARSQNLLTLAFAPPFLAATLCLLLAALVTGWRAFNRFGPPRAAERAIAFGKRALVSNGAGLIRRARRLHLLAAPYADAARERLARALGLPARLDAAASEAAIDRALAARDPAAPTFSAASAQLRAARRPAEMLRAAQALHSLERILSQ